MSFYKIPIRLNQVLPSSYLHPPFYSFPAFIVPYFATSQCLYFMSVLFWSVDRSMFFFVFSICLHSAIFLSFFKLQPFNFNPLSSLSFYMTHIPLKRQLRYWDRLWNYTLTTLSWSAHWRWHTAGMQGYFSPSSHPSSIEIISHSLLLGSKFRFLSCFSKKKSLETVFKMMCFFFRLEEYLDLCFKRLNEAIEQGLSLK